MYKTPAGAYTTLALAHVCRRSWWIVAIPVATCLCAAVTNPKWLLVALMVMLCIAPFLLANAYFSRLLSPEARKAISPMRLDIYACSHITMTYNLYEDRPALTLTVPWSQVRGVEPRGDGWLILLHDFPTTGLIVPRQAIEQVIKPESVEN